MYRFLASCPVSGFFGTFSFSSPMFTHHYTATDCKLYSIFLLLFSMLWLFRHQLSNLLLFTDSFCANLITTYFLYWCSKNSLILFHFLLTRNLSPKMVVADVILDFVLMKLQRRRFHVLIKKAFFTKTISDSTIVVIFLIDISFLCETVERFLWNCYFYKRIHLNRFSGNILFHCKKNILYVNCIWSIREIIKRWIIFAFSIR